MAEIPTREEFEDRVDELIEGVEHSPVYERERKRVLAAYDAQAARISELEAIIGELSADLADEIRARYDPNGTGVHPALKPKYERDIDVCRRARALFKEA